MTNPLSGSTPSTRFLRLVCCLGVMTLVLGMLAEASSSSAALSTPEASPASLARPGPRTISSLSATTALEPLRLLFEQRPPPSGEYRHFVNSGSRRLRTSVASLDSGFLTDAPSRRGSRGQRALKTPGHKAGPDAPRAIIRVRDLRGADALNPAGKDFTFGADFRLNKVSAHSFASSTDNGDNLIQRGLYDQSTQYKVQLDHRVAWCRVKGSRGAVEVASPVTIHSGRWYRVRCARDGATVRISVTSWRDGTSHQVVRSRAGTIGDLTPRKRSTPLSVGGKLTSGGNVVNNADQFNGRIDNVMLRIS